ncbi:FAD-dependent oxidoreductase [Cupriavidus necator]|uniref:FAD-dependent oxidoreductase n=1 Tax=Cupriavidus necator TaxID=106590 RepID=UPI0039C25D9A
MNDKFDADVVIVGCGVAGLSAAVTALEAGLKVINLERSDESHFGGNSRWTEAYMRMKNDSEISADFEEHFANNAGWNIDPNVLDALTDSYADWPSFVKSHSLPDPEVISAFANSVPSTISWLKGLGLKFEPQPIYLLTQNTTRIAAKGGGLAIIEALRAKALALGGEIRYRTTATDLVRNDNGAACGVVITNPDGVRSQLLAKHVVLASGGFQGNPEMMTKYVGPRAKHIRPVAIGGYYNRGEGIQMALNAGAAPAGEFGSYHAEPVDPRSRQAEAVVFIYPYGMLVNKLAKRFVNEAPGTVDAHYDNIARTIADQPDGISYVIFDSKVEDIPRWKTSIRSDQPPVSAQTLDALAAKLGLPEDAFAQTVATFNAACPQRSDAFEPFTVDHRGTEGLEINKSHWCRPIDQAPYYAYPIISTNCFTFGGLKVNENAQVLDQDGRVMAGLYAAGETMGIYHQVYTGSTSVLRGLVFGRRAAQYIALSNDR